MTIFRVKKDKHNPYVVINKHCLNNPNLSWKAKGLFCYLLSLPDDFVIYLGELIRHSCDGETAIRSAMDELSRSGYIHRERIRSDKGHFIGYNTHIYEVPIKSEDYCGSHPYSENPHVDNPIVDNPVLDNPILENHVLLNNKIQPYNEIQLSNKIQREEDDLTVTSSPPKISSKQKKKDMGTHLDPAIELTEEWRAIAIKVGIHPLWVEAVFEIFRTYWIEEKGKYQTKLNWKATWRAWCTTEVSRGQFHRPTPEMIEQENERVKAERRAFVEAENDKYDRLYETGKYAPGRNQERNQIE